MKVGITPPIGKEKNILVLVLQHIHTMVKTEDGMYPTITNI